MSVLTGIGWVDAKTSGAVGRGRCASHSDLRDLYRGLREDGILTASLANFGRCDAESKRLCLAAGLALYDAGIEPGGSLAQRTGLLLSGPDGAQTANLAYFRDYVSGGRALGRGNLFIYTLPTSPGAETAISYGLGGPLLYIGRETPDVRAAWRDAQAFVLAGQADAMLCVLSGPDETVCAVAGSRPSGSLLRCAAPTGAPESVFRLLDLAKGLS